MAPERENGHIEEPNLAAVAKEFNDIILTESNLTNESLSWRLKMINFYDNFKITKHKFLANYPLLIYSIKRIIFGLITLITAVCIFFVIIRLITDDSVYVSDIDFSKANIKVPSIEYYDLLKKRKEAYHVDGPIGIQLLQYLKNITPFIKKTIVVGTSYNNVTGKIDLKTETAWFYLGTYVTGNGLAPTGTPVLTNFAKAMPYSFAIGSVAFILAYLIGIPLGIISGRNKEKKIDSVINILSIILFATPALILVLMVNLFFVTWLKGRTLFASGHYSVILGPILALFLLIIPTIIIATRRYVIDEMTEEYVKFALAKGMTKKYTFYVHVFRNAGIRIIRVIPYELAMTIFGSSVLVERLWNIPGMSNVIIDAIMKRESFVMMGYIFLVFTAGIFTLLIADIIIVLFDPRIKINQD